MLSSWLRVLGWSAAIWLAVGLLRGAMRLGFHTSPGLILTVGYGVFFDAYWIPVTVILWQLTRWACVPRTTRGVRYTVVAIAGLGACIGFALWGTLAARLFYHRHLPITTALIRSSDTALLDVAVILTCAFAVHAYRTFVDGQAARIRLGRALHDAQLQMLTSQLQPHFLFNTLHLVSEIVRADRPLALTIISNLKYLLAQAAAYSHWREVPLEAELAFLESYVQIQESRFRGRLVVELEASPGTAGTLVPHLLLQPLVENAIKHGVGTRRGSGHVIVTAALSADQARLHLQVVDDGVGFSATRQREGIGLRNTRLRLDRLYGSGYRLRIEPLEPSGTRVFVDLPRKSSSTEAQNRYDTRSVNDAGRGPSGRETDTPSPRWLSLALHPMASIVGIIAGWVLIAVAWTATGPSFAASRGNASPFFPSLEANLANVAVWCVLTPFVIWMARRLRMSGADTSAKVGQPVAVRRRAVAVSTHVAVAMIVAQIHLTSWSVLIGVLGLPALTPQTASRVTWSLWDIGAYLLIAAATHLYDYVNWTQKGLAEMARLSMETSRARERIMRLRLQPRVLATVLHRLGKLAALDPDLCDEAISKAGDFLRALLRSSGTMEGTVATEAALARFFLDVIHVGETEEWSFELSTDPSLDRCGFPPGALLAIVAALVGDASMLRGRLEISIRRSADDRYIAGKAAAWYVGSSVDVAHRMAELQVMRAHWAESGGDPRAITVQGAPNSGVAVRFELALETDASLDDPRRAAESVA